MITSLFRLSRLSGCHRLLRDIWRALKLTHDITEPLWLKSTPQGSKPDYGRRIEPVVENWTVALEPKMRRGGSPEYDEMTASHSYFTYRPLSNLPTPPPTYRDGTSSPTNTTSSLDDDVDYLDVTYRGEFFFLGSFCFSFRTTSSAAANCQAPPYTLSI